MLLTTMNWALCRAQVRRRWTSNIRLLLQSPAARSSLPAVSTTLEIQVIAVGDTLAVIEATLRKVVEFLDEPDDISAVTATEAFGGAATEADVKRQRRVAVKQAEFHEAVSTFPNLDERTDADADANSNTPARANV